MNIYYFSSTHWDREWYETFQSFRERLVQVVADLCDYLEENDEFGTFHFDGQTIVLEDVAEVRPDLSDRLARLIQSGRVLVGPWYVMPDEFLVSGEAIIRNLLRGFSIARSYGVEPWRFGYIPDIFGHIAHMPQIFNGFGIDMALLGRGTNESTTQPFFRWQAPDGSSCVCVKLNDTHGYGDFNLSTFGVSNELMQESEFKQKAFDYIESLRKKAGTQPVVLMDGIDHAPLHEHTPQYIAWMQELYPQATFHHTDLREIRDTIHEASLQTISGELIEPARDAGGFLHLITNTLSSRHELKQKNDENQTALERVIEPICALQSHADQKTTIPYLDLAWKYTLQNHPHDSICGCSIDRVHQDMMYRFHQVEDLIDIVRRHHIRQDTRSAHNRYLSAFTADTNVDDPGLYVLRVWNPLPYERVLTRNWTIEVPAHSLGTFSEPFGYQEKPAFLLRDEADNIIPYRLVDVQLNQRVRTYDRTEEQRTVMTVTCSVRLRAMGWTSVRIERSDRPVRYLSGLLIAGTTAENETTRVEFDSSGALILHDKLRNRVYRNVLCLSSDPEIGDGWFHASPVGAQVRYSQGGAVSVVCNAPDRVVFLVDSSLTVPGQLNWTGTLNEQFGSIVPDQEQVVVPVRWFISLNREQNGVGISLEIDNRAADHCIRWNIPTGHRGPYRAFQTFGFVERPAGRYVVDGSETWKELEPQEKNFSGILERSDPDSSFALLARSGVHEVAVMDDETGTVRCTLLRSFRRTPFTNGEHDGLAYGRHRYEFEIVFSDGSGNNEKDTADLFRAWQSLSTDPVVYTGTRYDGLNERSELQIRGPDICYSTLKPTAGQADQACVLRLFNAAAQPRTATCTFARSVVSCVPCRLDETPISGNNLEESAHTVSLEIEGNRIASFLIQFKTD